jgi:hypothetical protein
MSRELQRRTAAAVLAATGTAGSLLGLHFDHGYVAVVAAFFAVMGALGLLGVNVFRGGVFDPALDGHDFVTDTASAVRLRFEQRRGALALVVELFDEKIVVSASGVGNHRRFAVPYESVLRDPIEFSAQREGTPAYVYAILGMIGIPLLAALTVAGDDDRLYLAVLTAMFLVPAIGLWRFDRRKAKPLLQLSESTPPLVVFADSPSPNAVSGLVRAIRERKASYLASHQGAAVTGLLVETLERLYGLKQAGAITDEEYERFKAEALRKATGGGERPGQYL